MSKNDNDFISRMTSLFVKISKESIINIVNALKEKDIITIKKEIHKLKPSFNNMSISILENDMKKLENYTSKKVTKDINDIVLNLIKNIQRIVKQLENEKLH